MMVKHFAQTANPDYTLCGDASDLNKLDDVDAETPWFAKPGELITCPKCRKQIDEIRSDVTRNYRVRKETR